MTKWLPIIVTVAGTLSAALAVPTLITAHPTAFAVLNALGMILHAVLPSVFGKGE